MSPGPRVREEEEESLTLKRMRAITVTRMMRAIRMTQPVHSQRL